MGQIRVERTHEGKAATVIIDRVDKMNALSVAMRAAYGDWAGEALPISYSANDIAAGENGVTLSQSITRGEDTFHQSFLVAQQEGEWKILAVSAIA